MVYNGPDVYVVGGNTQHAIDEEESSNNISSVFIENPDEIDVFNPNK